MAYQNFYATRLATDIGATDTTITVEIAPTATSGRLVLEARNPTQREIIKYAGVSGNQLTGVQRAQGGTVAAPHLKNALVEMNVTAGDLKDLYDAWDTFVASANNGWTSLAIAPTLLATNGNRSFDISVAGDKTAILAKTSRLLIPRTGTTSTQSADFNGTTQFAKKTGATGHTYTDDFTAEANIFMDSYPASGATGAIVGRLQGSPLGGWVMSVNAVGQLRIYTKDTAQTADTALSNTSIPLGRWVHVALSVDISGNVSRMYFDGVEQPTIYNNGGTVALSQVGDLAIGAESTGGNFFDGRISDVRVWSTIRTPQQIKDNANQQLAGTETGLVGYWKLNGDFNDSTTNANHLTAQAGASPTFAATPFGANAYAIVVSDPVFSGGNTTMTVQTPIGYTIPNQALGNASYSNTRTPFGFPMEKEKWDILAYVITSLPTVTNVADTWISSGMTTYLPKGSWRLSYSVNASWSGASATFPINVTALSSSTTVPTLLETSRMGSGGSLAATAWRDVLSAATTVQQTAPATYYLLIQNHRPGTLGVATEFGSTAQILAECVYL